MVLTNALAEAIRFGTELGRKFEPSDIIAQPWLRQVATDYALSTQDTTGFMGDMARAANGRYGLSVGQMKGVLNVALARSRTPVGNAPDLPNLKDLTSGRFRVVQADGSSTAVRLDSAAWSDKPKGTRSIGIRTAEGWTNLGFVEVDGSISLWQRGRPHLARLAAALTTVVNGIEDGSWLVYALSYSQDASECAFCGLELDTPESLTVGYGPVCAKKRGLPWGAKAEPMSVILARQAAGEGTPPPPSSTPTTAEAPSAEPKRARTYDEVFPPDPTPPTPARTSLADLARQIEGGVAF